MAFQNSSYYILPMAVDSVDKLEDRLNKNDWTKRSQDTRRSHYLFNYVSRIIEDDAACRVYHYAHPHDLPVYLFEKEAKLSASPVITAVSLYVFATGIAFLEYKVEYGNLSLREIYNFAYYFKLAARAEKAKYEKGNRVSLMRMSHMLLGEQAPVVFFFGQSKKQASCFHMVKTTYKNEHERNEILFRLKRSYTENFLYDEKNDCGRYDMTYVPYEYMAFGGCQEGFAAICQETDIEAINKFLNGYFFDQMNTDYHYMYLILLNQRFSGMRYIEEVATKGDTKELVEQISRKIIHLKTKYSFHVVSDDYIFQNVYSHMYEILDIDKLFLDIEENGDRLALVQSNDSAQIEKENSNFLMYISLLAVFSALIDMASYLDRMSFSTLLSTIASFICVGLILIFAVLRIFRKRKRK